MRSCPECGRPTSSGWCTRTCETNFMRGKFSYWTSGNKNIDELIQHTQLHASQYCDYLEWIPFEAFEMVKYIKSGGFSSIYSAIWLEGPRRNWNDHLKEWIRTGPIKVALKRLDNSLGTISSSYVNQVIFISFLLAFQIIHHLFIYLCSNIPNRLKYIMNVYNWLHLLKYLELQKIQHLITC